jgi:hypothetical protein
VPAYFFMSVVRASHAVSAVDAHFKIPQPRDVSSQHGREVLPCIQTYAFHFSSNSLAGQRFSEQSVLDLTSHMIPI